MGEVSKSEQIEHGVQCIDNLHLDLVQRWNQRLTLSNPRFIERYLNQELWFLVQFRWDSIDYIACLQHAGRFLRRNDTPNIRSNKNLVGMFPGPAFSRFFEFGGCFGTGGINVGYRNQQAVLVEVVQLREFPEKVVPS